MAGLWWISDVRTYREIAMFVLKYAIQHNKLFTPRVHVRRKLAARRITHYGTSPGNLVTDSIQWSSVNTNHWRIQPFQILAMHNDSFFKLRINLHLLLLKDIQLNKSPGKPCIS